MTKSGSRRTNISRQTPVVNRQPAQPPVVVNQSGGFLSNMMGSVMTGVGLGAGSEIGHRAISGLMGNGEKKEVCDRTRLNECLKEGGECVEEMRQFMRCLEGNK